MKLRITTETIVARLAEAALAHLLDEVPAEQRERVRPDLHHLAARAYAVADHGTRRKLRQLAEEIETGGAEVIARAPPEEIERLRRALGWAGLLSWVDHHPEVWGPSDREATRSRLAEALRARTPDGQIETLDYGIRYALGLTPETDTLPLEMIGEHPSPPEEDQMDPQAILDHFAFDTQLLPDELNEERRKAYVQAVADELKNTLGVNVKDEPITLAAVLGLLLLDEHFDPAEAAFPTYVQTAYFELLKKMEDFQTGKATASGKQVYQRVAEILRQQKGGGTKIFFQELASVGRFVFANQDAVPFNHPSFPTQVRLGDDRYVSTPAIESLDVPPLTTDDGATTEINIPGIRAIAVWYVGWVCEKGVRIFDVVDRLTELFMNGLLPVGLDSGGKALDRYYWDSQNRMDASARMMQYARIFGDSGADISREVQPHKEFDTLWLRFLSSLVEYDRQQRVDGLFFGNARGQVMSASSTGEFVRKAGRDLAASLSYYSYGYTQHGARRLNQHLHNAFDILSSESIKRLYGVSTPWQVIERVAAQEFGQAVNIVRYRTMADAGKRILDLVASNAHAWTNSSDRPLFADPAVPIEPDIKPADQRELVRHAQNWLAVNGIDDAQVESSTRPTPAVAAPSIPSFSAPVAAARGNGRTNGGGSLDQLKQMVAQGQTPSLDQLRALLPT